MSPTKHILAAALALGLPGASLALESDRQKPLEVNADSTNGTLGDGITVLSGHVEVRQGTLHIRADEAEVDKLDGRVQTVTLRGRPAYMEQEIEEQGLVKAEAATVVYRVGPGLLTLTGSAIVDHPQYEVSGDSLTYDLNEQHFQGNGGQDGNGRIRIRLDPEVEAEAPAGTPPADAGDAPEGTTGDSLPDAPGDEPPEAG